MNQDRITFALKSLAAAARGQGDARYDHADALIDANVTERGDALTPLAIAWCDGIPAPYRTLIHYQDAADPTGFDMSEVFRRALHAFSAKHEQDRNAERLAAIPSSYLPPEGGEECGRGRLTAEIRGLLESFFGRPTSVAELRLLPYLHYCTINERRIDPNRINGTDREILSQWRAAGLIQGGATDLMIRPAFFRFIGEVLLLAYVDFDREGVIQ